METARKRFGACKGRRLAFGLALAFLLFVLWRPAVGQVAGPPATTTQTTYTVTDLGTLGGTFGVAVDINNRSQAVGGANVTGDTEIHALLWSQSARIELGSLPGGPNSFANAINELAQVVGKADSSSSSHDANAFYCPSSVDCHSFLWQNGVMTDLGTLGGNSSLANWINNGGQIVGVSEINAFDPNTPGAQIDRAYLFENGTMTDLGTLGGFNGFADMVNDAGQIAGGSEVTTTPDPAVGFVPFHASLITKGVMKDLGTLGGEFSHAFIVNGKNQVDGVASLPGEQHVHGFLWQNSVMTDLGTVTGDTDSIAFGMNDLGQIVGGSGTSTTVRAVLWENGVITDLNTLIPSDSPLELLLAFWISPHGKIVGCALHKSTGEVHAYLLTPTNNSIRGKAGGASLPESVRKLLLRRPGLGHAKFLTSNP